MINMVNVLAALAQRTRLDVLTLLARGPVEGQTSGDLALQSRVPANSMSTHLSILAAAGLVSATRSGRSIIYRIEREMIGNVLENLAARLTGAVTEKLLMSGLLNQLALGHGDARVRQWKGREANVGPSAVPAFATRITAAAGCTAEVECGNDEQRTFQILTRAFHGEPLGSLHQ